MLETLTHDRHMDILSGLARILFSQGLSQGHPLVSSSTADTPSVCINLSIEYADLSLTISKGFTWKEENEHDFAALVNDMNRRFREMSSDENEKEEGVAYARRRPQKSFKDIFKCGDAFTHVIDIRVEVLDAIRGRVSRTAADFFETVYSRIEEVRISPAPKKFTHFSSEDSQIHREMVEMLKKVFDSLFKRVVVKLTVKKAQDTQETSKSRTTSSCLGSGDNYGQGNIACHEEEVSPIEFPPEMLCNFMYEALKRTIYTRDIHNQENNPISILLDTLRMMESMIEASSGQEQRLRTLDLKQAADAGVFFCMFTSSVISRFFHQLEKKMGQVFFNQDLWLRFSKLGTIIARLGSKITKMKAHHDTGILLKFLSQTDPATKPGIFRLSAVIVDSPTVEELEAERLRSRITQFIDTHRWCLRHLLHEIETSTIYSQVITEIAKRIEKNTLFSDSSPEDGKGSANTPDPEKTSHLIEIESEFEKYFFKDLVQKMIKTRFEEIACQIKKVPLEEVGKRQENAHLPVLLLNKVRRIVRSIVSQIEEASEDFRLYKVEALLNSNSSATENPSCSRVERNDYPQPFIQTIKKNLENLKRFFEKSRFDAETYLEAFEIVMTEEGYMRQYTGARLDNASATQGSSTEGGYIVSKLLYLAISCYFELLTIKRELFVKTAEKRLLVKHLFRNLPFSLKNTSKDNESIITITNYGRAIDYISEMIIKEIMTGSKTKKWKGELLGFILFRNPQALCYEEMVKGVFTVRLSILNRYLCRVGAKAMEQFQRSHHLKSMFFSDYFENIRTLYKETFSCGAKEEPRKTYLPTLIEARKLEDFYMNIIKSEYRLGVQYDNGHPGKHAYPSRHVLKQYYEKVLDEERSTRERLGKLKEKIYMESFGVHRCIFSVSVVNYEHLLSDQAKPEMSMAYTRGP